VVGVPRSGMIPASFLAIRLGVPLATISKNRKLVETSTGLRLRDVEKPSGTILFVEDSSASGFSIGEIRREFGHLRNAKFTAVYATPKATQNLDYYGRILPMPHWFQWNIFGNRHLMKG